MEKKYFIKYVPVEGEIEPGDRGLTNFSKIVFKALPETMNLCKGKQKVKLFLCSRDIQVGDKAYSDHDPSVERLVVDHFDLSPYPTMEIGVEGFKVIGEISPEATWVTEGMEFDEDQVYKTWKYFNEEYGYSYEPFWDGESVKKHIITIKCPCCNSFK